MTVTVTHDLEARRRSYELLADVMGLGDQQPVRARGA
jgi:hypothetical protein